MQTNSKKISNSIILLPVIGIVITALMMIAVSIYSLNQYYNKQKQETINKFMENLKKTTKEKVNLAYVIVDALYKKNLKIYKDKQKAKEATFKDFPLFHLPGDIIIKKENFTFYFPITSSILISIILSVVFYIISRIMKWDFL